MKILIVDDSIIKINKIKTVINETNVNSEFLIAHNKADAMSFILLNLNIDLMILDLNLPNRKGEEPKRLAGLSLLKELNRRASISKPQHIIGLTAYTELKNETTNEFVENGWIIITYDNKKSDWEATIKNKVDYINNNIIHKPVPASNDFALIMKGGGIKGLAYVGALEELSKQYKFDWFAGTSAGAVSAILLGAGFNVDELKKILIQKDFSDFKDANFIKKVFNLFTKQGLYEAETFNSWLTKEISRKLDSSTNVKLKDLPNRVTVYASRREKKALVFDSNNNETKSTSAVFAARCSMSIPIFFTPQKTEGLNVFDGGAQNNYPVKILMEHNPNTKFIGLYLGSEHYEHPKKISLLKEMLSIWTEAMDYEALEEYKDETIIIDTRPISTLKFKLNQNEKEFLLECGRVGALKYLIKNNIITPKNDNYNTLKESLENKRKQLIKRSKKQKLIKKIVYSATILLSIVLIILGKKYLIDVDEHFDEINTGTKVKIEQFSPETVNSSMHKNATYTVLSSNSFSYNYDDLILNISIDNNLNTYKSKYDDSLYPSRIQYSMNINNDTVYIKPHSKEIDQFNNHEVIKASNFQGVYENTIGNTSNLDIKITNNSNKAVFLNELEIINSSKTIKEPFILPFIVKNEFLVLKNVGWGQAKDIKLKAKVLSIFEYSTKDKEIILQNTVELDTLKNMYYTEIINIMKVHKDSFYLESNEEQREINEYRFMGKENKRFDSGVVLCGEYSYKFNDTFVKKRFISDELRLYNSGNLDSDIISLSNIDYSLEKKILLKSDIDRDSIIVPISIGLKDKDVDRLSLRFLSNKRSRNHFKIKFYYNDKVSELPLTFSLDYFITPDMVEEMRLD